MTTTHRKIYYLVPTYCTIVIAEIIRETPNRYKVSELPNQHRTFRTYWNKSDRNVFLDNREALQVLRQRVLDRRDRLQKEIDEIDAFLAEEPDHANA